jgi:hypothetical protein
MLRFQLINEFIGELLISEADPIDINAITKVAKRSAQYEGATFEVMLEVRFIKAARNYLIDCFNNAGGVDALVIANVYYYHDNRRRWLPYSTGQVDWNGKHVDEDSITVNLEQTGVERRVLNMMEMDVDLETLFSENGSPLPILGQQIIPFHSKTLLKELLTKPANSDEFQQLDVAQIGLPALLIPTTNHIGFVTWGQFDNSEKLADDLEDGFETPYGWQLFDEGLTTDVIDQDGTDEKYIDYLTDRFDVGKNPMHVPTENGTTDINVTIKAKHSVHADNTGGDIDMKSPNNSGCLGHVEVYAWCEHQDKDKNVLFIEKIGQWDMTGYGGVDRIGDFETKTYTKTGITTSKGDQFFVYNTYRVWGFYENPNLPGSNGVVHHDFLMEVDDTVTRFDFTSQTIDEASDVQAPLLFEAFERCLQFYTNEIVCFKSDLLGRTDRGYAVDGKGSLIAWTNGNRVRQRNEKKQFTNLKQLIDFANSLFCVGFGFEVIGGRTMFVLEERSYFYDKTLKIMSLGKVFNVETDTDNKRYMNIAEYGYSNKIDLKQVNSIDEFNTIRKSRVPIINTKNALKIATDVVTGGYQIELERRLRLSKEDGKYDDSNIAVVVIRDGLGYKTKKDEGYDYINNVFSPETGYNYDISPASNFQNWIQWISACMIRSFSKIISFSSGEVNYEMVKKKTSESTELAENGNVSVVGIEPLIDPEVYTLKNIPITAEEMQNICDNYKGYIEFEDKDNVVHQGFLSIEGIEHDQNAKMALSMKLLKVNRKVL